MKIEHTDVQRIHALHAEGRSEREIARIIGCSRSAVWGQLQK